MFKSTALFMYSILLVLAGPAFAGKIHQVITYDAQGDVAGCVAGMKKYNELARKVVPKNHPSVRVVQATSAGNQTGLLWLVVEYDDLADYARTEALIGANEELTALGQENDKSCKVVSQSLGEELYYHPGTK